MKHDRIKSIIRVLIVFFISIIIWRLMILFMGMRVVSDNLSFRIIVGIFTSILVGSIITVMTCIANKKIDLSLLKVSPLHLKSFVCGFFCWIIPATLSVYVFILLGYININLYTSISDLVPQFFFLLAMVFFIEAFPEEIIRSYIFSNLVQSFSPWIALLIQTVLFTLFAYFIGSLYSTEQILFIPGFGFLLGYFRMISKNASFSMGFHLAIMTITQLLASSYTQIVLDGNFFILRFLCFVLFPSIISSSLLHIKLSNKK